MLELTAPNRGLVTVEVYLPALPDVVFEVRRWRGCEQLSAPFVFELELSTRDSLPPISAMVGTDIELLFERGGPAHVVHGMLDHARLEVATEHGIEVHDSTVHVRMVPAFKMLDQGVQTRFFVDKTPLQILRQVLEPALAAYQRTVDLSTYVEDEHPRRDYCVAFRESTFAFCSRLMEEEGIAYFFVPSDHEPCETLVLVEGNAPYRAVDRGSSDPIPLIRMRNEYDGGEAVESFEVVRTRTPNRIATRGYDRNTASMDDAYAQRRDESDPVLREQVLDEVWRQIVDGSARPPENVQRTRIAERIQERHSLESALFRGHSNVIGFAPGFTFELDARESEAIQEQRFLLTRVDHEGGIEAGTRHYRNTFECIPLRTTFRPARRTPRPSTAGLQLGVVVGPTQDEIYTDALGRIRVKFHLDREPGTDGRNSCWVPVLQSWAGAGFGSVVIPRVGMEVAVTFIDGNPDCPVVTGCLYHGNHAPALTLPEDATRSTFRTSSSPGGEGYNELRFEDARGYEQVFLHAQRRLDLIVGQNAHETIGASREEHIGSERNGEKSGDHNTLVHRDVNHHIKGTRYLRVGEEQHATVVGNCIEDYGADRIITVGGTSQLSAPTVVVESSDSINLKATDMLLGATSAVEIKAGSKVILESSQSIELKVGASFISVSPDGISISGPLIRLNSGGGVGSARGPRSAKAVEILDPLDAARASEALTGGSGPPRERISRRLDPHRAATGLPSARDAPTPAPMRAPAASFFAPEPGPRQIESIEWAEAETWCSEPATLQGTARGYERGETEFANIRDATDGSTLDAAMLTMRGASFREPYDVVDLLPRKLGANYEAERSLNASAALATTPRPIRLRFLPNLALEHCSIGVAQFDMMVLNHEVIIENTIFYVEGWLNSIIQLDAHVPPGTGGDIGINFGAPRPGQVSGGGWRYCKEVTTRGRTTEHYWDGATWTPVPRRWSNPRDTKLLPCAIWLEGASPKTSYGSLPWPDPIPVWGPADRAHANLVLSQWTRDVNSAWSHKFSLKRRECRSTHSDCCSYKVRVNVKFVPVATLGSGIVLAANDARSDSGAWSLRDPDAAMPVHEFGHHLGNPDEYRGASINPALNTDGARRGIDRNSIMGDNMTVVKRRHFNVIGHHMAAMVHHQVGRAWHFDPTP